MKKILASKIFWLIAVIVIIGGAFIIRNASKPEVAEYVTETAKIDRIVQSVSATGQVKSASDITLNFKNAGTVSVVRVTTGQQVKARDILAQLKATDLSINITKAYADLEEARANLKKVTAGSTNEELAVTEAALAKIETDLITAQADALATERTYRQAFESSRADLRSSVNTSLTKANISLQKIYDTLFYKGDDDNFNTSNVTLEQMVHNQYANASIKVAAAEKASNTAVVSGSDADLETAAIVTIDGLESVETALEDLTSLFEYVILTTTLTQSDLDTLKATTNSERTAIDSSVNTLNAERQSVTDARITYETKVEAAQNAVVAAEQNVLKAEADLALKKAGARPEDLTLYQARVRRAEADLRLAQDRYEDTVLRAPIDGVITAVNVDVGEQASSAQPAITMLATEEYEIEVDIPESDIAKITLGDRGEITLDAFTDDELFTGTVTTINPAQTEIQNVIYYRVTISFSQEQPANVASLLEKIKPGMTADVTIQTDQKENVLVIPSRAVKEVNGERVVTVLENNQPVKKTVTVGLRGDDGLVEITSGLEAGEAVVTFVRTN